MNDELFASLLATVLSHKKEKYRRELIFAAAHEHAFDSEQMKSVMALLEDGTDKVEVAANLFSKLVDIENAREVLKVLSPDEQKRLETVVGKLFRFNPAHSTGHYLLDLSQKFEMFLAQVGPSDRLCDSRRSSSSWGESRSSFGARINCRTLRSIKTGRCFGTRATMASSSRTHQPGRFQRRAFGSDSPSYVRLTRQV